MPNKPADPLAIFRQNLREELEAKRATMRSASIEAELGETFIRDVLERGRNPQLSYVAKLAKVHGLSIDRLLNLPAMDSAAKSAQARAVQVIGEVSAGTWHDVGGVSFPREDSPFPPDTRYPVDAQFDLIVRGSSINRFARDGERLRCVDITKAGIEPFDDDIVIFEQTRDHGSLVETTAKRYRRRGPIVELWPDSDDPRWQEPQRIDTRNAQGREGRIVALVLYSYNPARSAARRR